MTVPDDLQQRAAEELKDLENLEDSFFSDDDMEEVLQQSNSNDRALRDPQAALQYTAPSTDRAILLAEEEQILNNPVLLYRMFYRSLFPYDAMFRWLSYDTVPTKNFTHREFSFGINDTYMRYRSYDNLEAMKKEIERFQPTRIDIGAVYSLRPRDKNTVSENRFDALAKELVFDIDLTDYDDIRTCCSGRDICLTCWQLIQVGMEVIDTELRETWGFKHMLWVYSGSRGVHCWVCDKEARELDDKARKAVITSITLSVSGAAASRKARLSPPLYPSDQRSLEIIEKHFEQVVLNGLRVLDTPSTSEALLNLVPFEDKKLKIRDRWSEKAGSWTPKEKWEYLVKEVRAAEKKARRRQDFSTEMKFHYCYPRLDANVSKARNHLLKSPLSVHPKTLKVCVPIDPREFYTFNPLDVPDLKTLAKELRVYDMKNPSAPGDYSKTSLAPYIQTFEKFLTKLH